MSDLDIPPAQVVTCHPGGADRPAPHDRRAFLHLRPGLTGQCGL